MKRENKISNAHNLLVVLADEGNRADELQFLMDNFCGEVVTDVADPLELAEGKRVYVCGDISKLGPLGSDAFVIRELSSNFEDRAGLLFTDLGKVPIVVHNAGVFYRRFFEGKEFFQRVKEEHTFQELTESNKLAKALRKGIYLTDIAREESAEAGELLHYRLLRCSSNLTGPTDNFRETDREIIAALNEAARSVFEVEPQLNHVLVQVYENKKHSGAKGKEVKAKISTHADKTKDMLAEGLIAFCTFYDSAGFEELKPSKSDRFDWVYKKGSGLTQLYFKLKSTVTDKSLVPEFSVTLYPNSVFMIPLSTNRLYTHAIRPSMLNIDRIPTRMGYVVRSSKAEAVFIDGQTFLKEAAGLVKLEEKTPEGMADLRTAYREENKTDEVVEYGRVLFSMNSGDYKRPLY